MQDLNNKATAVNHQQTERQYQDKFLPVNDPFTEIVPSPVEISQADALDLVSDRILDLQEQIKLADTLEDEQEKEALLERVKKLIDEMFTCIDKAVGITPMFQHNSNTVHKLLDQRTKLIGLFMCLNFSCFMPETI